MNAEQKRQHIAARYAQTVTERCQATAVCGDAGSEMISLVSYSPDVTADLPPEAVVTSLGCGNPVMTGLMREGQTVLDLGCGAGLDLLLAAKKVGPTGRVIGVDMTDEMIARARANIERSSYQTIEVRKGIIEDLPVDNQWADWVISNCVITLSPEKKKVFAEIARVLKPGGCMMVADLVLEPVPNWVREKLTELSSCLSSSLTEADYLNELAQAGLIEAEIRDRVVYSAGQLTCLIHPEPECGSPQTPPPDRNLAEALEGRVRSVMLFARKPDRVTG